MAALRRLSMVALIVLAARPAGAGEPAEKAGPVRFNRDIRPILARNCFACHGPDEGQRKAKLRLDTREGAFADREGTRPFVPGDLEESEALRRVLSDDPLEQMPPGGPDKRLEPGQVELLRRWVEQGAEWESHWAFEPPVRRSPPEVRDADWPRNPIDRFVLARLEAEGLHPSPEADRATLARRVSLDLTGLPPTPEELERFLADHSPDAYERLVDRLLASPHYGERWARVWLDLARFADTKGYEKDLKRNIWRYRDWVIDAFNADRPYDAFTAEQLAGDLLPDPTPDQLLATAFHRNTLTNDEGGTDDEEFRVAAVKDRVDTTAQVWMGLTMGCAKCHTHKYDPIAHREYYQFYGFFDQTADADRYDEGPTEPLPAPAQQAEVDRLRGAIAAAEAALYERTPTRLDAFRAWESEQRVQRSWTTVRPWAMEAASGSDLRRLDDGSVRVIGIGPERETYTLHLPLPAGKLTGIRVEAIPDPSLPKKGSGRSRDDGNFVLSRIDATIQARQGGARPLAFASAEADFAQEGYPVEHAIRNPDPAKHGWAVSPRQAEPHQAVFRLAEPVDVAEGSNLELTLDHRFQFAYPGFSLGRFRVSTTTDAEPGLDRQLPAEIAAILDTPEAGRSEEQRTRLFRHFMDQAPAEQPGRDALAKLRGEVDALLASVRTPILRELPADKRRVTKVHNRGNFLDPGEAVEPATPASFHPFPEGAPRNRLGVARWLMDARNPLTARVAVNRHWSHLFGRGLVETEEDFGTQGAPPSHPELLDWLAVEFRESGWSFKRLCRLIVTSATYRQQSRVGPELAGRDGPNRLFARGPRFRLEAEMVRDSALLVSGLLSRKLHGPSVMPHQPEGIWRSTYNTTTWTLSPGEDRYRRGLYTFVKRTSPYPAMLAFDAPSREYCTIRRIATNTPLQALVTLNDPAFVEAAQALARRMADEGGPSVSGRIGRGLRLALLREPEPREVEALAGLYRRRLEVYRANPSEAVKLATEPLGPLPAGADAPELAALTAVANVILNLDEFLTRN